MTRLVRSELVKLATTRGTWFLVLGTICLVALATVAQLFPGSGTGIDPGTAATQRDMLASMTVAGFVALVVGIVSVSGEYRCGTITSTFLVTPRRERVLAAKLAAVAGVAFALALAAAAAAIAAALIGLRLKGYAVLPSTREIARMTAGSTGQAVIDGMIGVAVGALLRSQIAAIVVAVLWGTVVEAMVMAVSGDIGRMLPVAAAEALVGTNADLLDVWPAIAVSACWVAALGALAAAVVLRRDVT